MNPIQIPATEFYTFLGLVIAILGWIARQQMKWMANVDKSVHRLELDIAVIKTVLRIKDDDHNRSDT